MPKGIARLTLYLILSVPLLVLGVLISRQIQYSLEFRKNILSGNSKLPYADVERIMATNELATRSFFLIFICFVMILCGLLIVIKGQDNAFNSTKDAGVRYSLKTAFPGLIMAIAGCLLLTYSVYKSYRLQFDNSGINHETAQRVSSDEQMPIVSAVKNVARQRPVEKPAQPAVESGIPVEITDSDIQWADNLALQSVVYGYVPRKDEKQRYDIVVKEQGSSSVKLNENLRWAFSLLLQTQKGYQPGNEEWARYESLVSTYINRKADTSLKGVVGKAN